MECFPGTHILPAVPDISDIIIYFSREAGLRVLMMIQLRLVLLSVFPPWPSFLAANGIRGFLQRFLLFLSGRDQELHAALIRLA